MLKLSNKQQAFTIVELLIVIVIIGILAAVSFVAYSNVSSKARASSLSSALSQASKKLELYKTENGNYPANLTAVGIDNNTSATYTYTATDSNTNYCLTAVNGDISYSLNNSTKLTPVEGGCNGHTWPGGVAMTNLVINGDFSQGASGWIIPASWAVSDGALNSTASGAAQAYRHVGGLLRVSGNKYYISASLESYSSGGVEIHLGGLSPNSYTSALGRFSHVNTASVSANGNIVFGRNGGVFIGTVDNVLAINLTAAFGAGKEPTKAQMDQIMQQFPNSWFNGTVTANTKGVL